MSKNIRSSSGTVEEMDKFSRRTVKVTREHNEECRRLLGLMGIPVVVAPSEAEAQCAALARDGKVYAAGSEGAQTNICSFNIQSDQWLLLYQTWIR